MIEEGKKIKVSIIVPIHNAGVYLKKCLDTLVNQTLSEIEIILVIDCPTDGSDLIAKEYAAKDDRIVIIINDKNLHIGLSRNEGLKVARGEYIGFSDHDDFREFTMYEELYNEAKKTESDVVVSGYGSIMNNKVQKHTYPDLENKPLKDLLFELSIGGNGNMSKEWRFFILNGGMWNKIYKNEFIKKHDIFFEDNRTTTFEDLLFLISCFHFANSVTLVNKVFYYHMENVNNASSQYFYNSYILMGAFLNKLNNFMTENSLVERYRMFFYNAVVNCVYFSIINEFVAKKGFVAKASVFNYFRQFSFVKIAFQNRKVMNIIYPAQNIITFSLRNLVFLYYRI